jgi:hypothetical protein
VLVNPQTILVGLLNCPELKPNRSTRLLYSSSSQFSLRGRIAKASFGLLYHNFKRLLQTEETTVKMNQVQELEKGRKDRTSFGSLL